MCTLTYLPLQEGHCIYHTRDEVPERHSPDFPIVENSQHIITYRPLDSLSMGSWIITTGRGITGCLLNGAFEKHERHPPYRHSRGKILLDVMQAEDKLEHLKNIDLDNIEPFTLVIFIKDNIIEMRWDEKEKHFKSLNPHQPHIWSSATLYPPEKIKERERWFAHWLEEMGHHPDTLDDFHHHGGVGEPEYDIVMKRERGPCSVSITSLVRTIEKGVFCFEDLMGQTKKCVELTYG